MADRDLPSKRSILMRLALRIPRLAGVWRRFGRPDGDQWASWLACHGGLRAMGRQCSIQTNVTITDPQYVTLGNNVRLSGCTLFGHDGSVNMLRVAFGLKLDRVGPVQIGDNVFVGHQAIVMPGVRISSNVIVAAGRVVTRDIPEDAVVAGVPARVVGSVRETAHRLAQTTQALPWAPHLESGGASSAHVSAVIETSRLEHFFGRPLPAAAGEGA